MKTVVKIKSVYASVAENDGYRVLVDRLWPRGLTKADVAFDDWLKDLAPSTALRKWYRHDPELWPEFQVRYRAELDRNKAVPAFAARCKNQHLITLLFAGKDHAHTHALVLQRVLSVVLNNK